jgi:hypothetical protein
VGLAPRLTIPVRGGLTCTHLTVALTRHAFPPRKPCPVLSVRFVSGLHRDAAPHRDAALLHICALTRAALGRASMLTRLLLSSLQLKLQLKLSLCTPISAS